MVSTAAFKTNINTKTTDPTVKGGTLSPSGMAIFSGKAPAATVAPGAGAPAASSGVSAASIKQANLDADPWSRYRAGAGDQLAAMQAQGDPSNIYREKLEQMVSGNYDITQDPSYQFRFDQGQQAVERSLAAQGLLNSGNAAIELQQYGQGAASQEFSAQFDRLLKGMSGVEEQYNMQMGRLMDMAGINRSPTAGGDQMIALGNLNLGYGQLANQAQRNANDYAVGMANANNQAASTAAGLRSSMYQADSNRLASSAQGQLQRYLMGQNTAAQNALESEAFFSRPGGILSGGY